MMAGRRSFWYEGHVVMEYRVKPADGSIGIDADWTKSAWGGVESLRLAHFMGERPTHFPEVEAKLLYDRDAIYVAFRVVDRYVRAVANAHQAAVYCDSCVEFFFAPGEDLAKGYFNLEMNCGGTMLFHHQVVPRSNKVIVDAADLVRIEVAHSLPTIVEPEVPGPITWTVEYRLPVDVLGKYAPDALRPSPGVRWRANFYKCADETSHPHWLTWSPVNHPSPDFHRPGDFGMLEFCAR
jgi:hypothetical protein